MTIRSGSPFVNSLAHPISLIRLPMVEPLTALSLDTRLSAGCDTTAQNTPAMYPAAKDTPSCSVLLHSALGLGTTLLYSSCTTFSNAPNFIMVYGIWRPHSGVRPLNSPPMPSCDTIFGRPSDRPLAKPGTVCTFTLVASKAHSPMSAKNSAEAEPARNNRVWYLAAFSGPAITAYLCLKYSYRPNFPAPCTEYPTKVGPQPFTRPLTPFSRTVVAKPPEMDLYFAGSVCMLHFTTSSGVTAVCVRPHERIPPIVHAR
mmetsp:Transcript_3286/g.9520  ORF Transcript_3286/g.9520 Transcript_3286/m.9520 type:complete len:258 (-) Transcript_3286:207-980(-)